MLDLHAYPPEPKKQQTKNRHAVRTHDSTRTPLDLHKPIPLLRNPWELYGTGLDHASLSFLAPPGLAPSEGGSKLAGTD